MWLDPYIYRARHDIFPRVAKRWLGLVGHGCGGVGAASAVCEPSSSDSDQSERRGWLGRVGDGGDEWPVTGSRVLSGEHSLSFFPGLVFLFPLEGIVFGCGSCGWLAGCVGVTKSLIGCVAGGCSSSPNVWES